MPSRNIYQIQRHSLQPLRRQKERKILFLYEPSHVNIPISQEDTKKTQCELKITTD